MLGKFELRRVIGRGAVGVVHLAWDTTLKREVAVKVVRLNDLPESEATEVPRTIPQEAQLASGLTHPGIVAIYDYGESDDIAYIAMEYVDGETLKALLDRAGALRLERALDIMQQMLRALDYCHRRRIVHRDLKPSNLMLSRDDHVKLTDFGIARTDTSDLTVVGEVLGTPPYMAPEQISAKTRANESSDIYSSGVVCYELLTGRRPFNDETGELKFRFSMSSPPPRPRWCPLCHRRSTLTVLRALAKQPAERFATAEAFAAALRAAVKVAPAASADDDTIAIIPSSAPGAPLPRKNRSPKHDAWNHVRWGVVGGIGGLGAAAVAIVLWIVAHGGFLIRPPPPVITPPSQTQPQSGTPAPVAPGPAVAALPSPPSPPAAMPNVVPSEASRATVSRTAPIEPPQMLEADLAAAVATLPCSTVTVELQPGAAGIVASGMTGAGAPRAELDDIIRRAGAVSVREEVSSFPFSPGYCQAADITRSVLAAMADGALDFSLRGSSAKFPLASRSA